MSRRILEFAAAGISVISFVAAIALHFGLADVIDGLSPLEELASRYDNSYTDSPPILRPSDPLFYPALHFISRYSKTPFDAQRVVVIERWVAVSSSHIPNPADPNHDLAQWTAPTTPIAVLYLDQPHVPLGDIALVGTIEDFHGWIQRQRDDTHFFIVDVLLGALAAVTTLLLSAITLGRKVTNERSAED